MTDDRCEWHLWSWSRWMYGGKSMHLRHRSRASAGTGWNTDFETMVENADLHCAEATDAAVDDLPKDQRDAIYAIWLEGRWTLPDIALPMYYRDAVKSVGRGLDRRGID